MTKINIPTTPLRSTVKNVSIQLYSLVAWLLVLVGGMVAVGAFFIGKLTLAELISGFSVGMITVAFGLGMARLLNRDLKQTAPVLWF
jgi:hypothetical protein